MPGAPQAAKELVASLLVACDAAVSQKSAGTLFTVSKAAASALRQYYVATAKAEVTIAFTLDGVEVDEVLVRAPDRAVLLHDLAYLFECTIVLTDPGETGVAIFMRRMADEVREPGLGGLDDIPGVCAGPPKRQAPTAVVEKATSMAPEVAPDDAPTGPPPPGFLPEANTGARTKPPPAGWSPALDDEDPFKNLM